MRRGLLLGGLGVVVVLGVLALVGVFEGDDPEPASLARVSPALGQADSGVINRIYDRASPGVVFIQGRVVQEQQSPFGPPGPEEGIATGTGFVLDREGYVATNAHVIENARDVRIRFQESSLVDAQVVGSDVSTDLALLKVDPRQVELAPLALADSAQVKVGDPVLALGNPLGLEDTITAGIISAKQRRITAPNGVTIEDVLQTDAAVNPGNSGGPLLDIEGRVIGVNSQIATAGGSGGFIGIAFAVPSDTAKRIIPDLRDDGRVSRPYLGVTALTVTPQLAAQLDLGVDRGALVTAVADGSPAARARLESTGGPEGALTGGGDVIVQVGDAQVRTAEDLAKAVADQRVGATVELSLVRDGSRRTVSVRLTDRPR